MPPITYTGPDHESSPIAIGPAQYIVFPKGQPVEVSEEIIALVREHPQSGEFTWPAAPPAPASKKK